MKLKYYLLISLLSCLLAACGGGKDISGNNSGSNSGTTGGETNGGNNNDTGASDTNTSYLMELALMSCSDVADLNSCISSSTLPVDRPSLILVTIQNSKGTPIPEAVVEATSIDYGIGIIQKPTRKQTNAAGQASFYLQANSGDDGEVGKIQTSATLQLTDGSTTTLNAQKTFTFGVLDLGLEVSATPQDLPLNSTSTITATLYHQGELYTAPVNVSFSSICASQQLATLDSLVTSSQGQAIATYKGSYQAEGATSSGICGQADTLTISVGNISKTLTITNQAPQASSILAGTPSSQFIYTPGSGFQDNVSITFTVTDTNGNPKASEPVIFSLSGITQADAGFEQYTLQPDEATTNSQGQVTVNAKAGAIPAPFRIAAALQNNHNIRTVSSQIGVGMGLPTHDSFTFSADKYNLEGWSQSDTEASIQIQLSDRYKNPVPNGTKVYLTTEGGTIKGDLNSDNGITGYCSTINGVCNATLVTTEPRPKDGRVTVLAYALGEESFFDKNGSKIFDIDDIAGTDVDEPYIDINFDHLFTSGIDVPFDLDGSGGHSEADGLYNGLLCSEAAMNSRLCSRELVNLYRNVEFVFTGVLTTLDDSQTGGIGMIEVQHCNQAGIDDSCNTVSDALHLSSATTNYLRFRPSYAMYDQGIQLANNPIPAGSQLNVSAENAGTISPCCNGDSYTNSYPADLTLPVWFWVQIQPAAAGSQGELNITATTPLNRTLASHPISFIYE